MTDGQVDGFHYIQLTAERNTQKSARNFHDVDEFFSSDFEKFSIKLFTQQ